LALENIKMNRNYVSLKGLASFITLCFYGLIFCNASFFILCSVNSFFSLPESDYFGTGQISVAFAIIALLSSIELIIRICTIIVFLIWLNKSFKNLPSLGITNAEFTPGWAVAWWFIPIASLFKPYQVIRELWNSSDADLEPGTLFSKNIGAPPLIGYWWGLFIAGNIIGRLSDKLAEHSAEAFTATLMLSSALTLGAAVLIIKIVNSITENQDIRSTMISDFESPFHMPPPPPTFE
jgi:hypothetical protein